ncbi:MAG: outer membrane protein assembly factor BamD [Salibacteraceae bacterium]
MIHIFTRCLVLSLTLTFGVLAFVGCSEYRKVLRSSDMQLKYDKALEYYKEGKYAKAYPLFEELFIIYRGTSKGERISYLQAMCDYRLKDYLLASHRFSQFARSYPQSAYAERAQFYAALCLYKMSPKYSLDQSDTRKAIRSLQLYALQYPASERMDSVNLLLDNLHYKLELKDYKKAKLYFDMKRYRAATVAFENFNKNYPNSRYKIETSFLEFKSAYLLALNSIDDKKLERINNALNAYTKFADRFAGSPYEKEALTLRKNLEALQNETKNTKLTHGQS